MNKITYPKPDFSKLNFRGYETNDDIRNAFQEYIESDDYKDNMELHKVFDDPQGALWCAFIAGWEARKEKETHE